MPAIVLESTPGQEARYKMDHKKRGYLVVIDNHTFNNLLDLEGSEHDVENLRNAFVNNLGFELVLRQNQTKAQMINLMKYFAQEVDHTNVDCFMVVFLSHGNSNKKNEQLICAIDEDVRLTDLTDPFIECSTLNEKPKIFFLDVCRGSKKEPSYAKDKAQNAKGNTVNTPKLPKFYSQKDFLFGFGSCHGFVAGISPSSGSHYTSCLCKSFNENGNSKELYEIVRDANRKLAESYQGFTAEIAKITLTKACFFGRTQREENGNVASPVSSCKTYLEQSRNDNKTGWETYTWPNGDTYKGAWKDGKKHGYGTYAWLKGGQYDGNYVDDKKYGWGTFTWSNGEKYGGNFIDGEIYGSGTFTWPNGDEFKGNYINGVKNGWGEFTLKVKNGKQKYKGNWKDGKKNGGGEYINSDGTTVKGNWKDDEKL